MSALPPAFRNGDVLALNSGARADIPGSPIWARSGERPHASKNQNLHVEQATSAREEPLARFGSRVSFFECAPNLLAVEGMLIKRQRVPFAAFGTEEVSTIDMDSAGELVDRVENRMNYIGVQGLGVRFAKCLGAHGLDLFWRFGNTP